MPFRLTTVATFRTPTSAWIARNYLATQGIRAHVFDEHIATAIWTWGNAIGWTKLQVETEFEQAAHQALRSWRVARDLLVSECSIEKSPEQKDLPLPPPCMDRKPVTAAERYHPTMNLREDLVRRAKMAAVCSWILAGNSVGLPGQWKQSTGIGSLFFLIGMFWLLGYSTRLLWTASQISETLRPMYQNDLFWARCANAVLYSLLALIIIYVVSLSAADY